MAMIAFKCPDIQVVVVDINAARIAAWNSDVRPPFLLTLLLLYQNLVSVRRTSMTCRTISCCGTAGALRPAQ
jgi:hypothetical protein